MLRLELIPCRRGRVGRRCEGILVVLRLVPGAPTAKGEIVDPEMRDTSDGRERGRTDAAQDRRWRDLDAQW